MQFQKVFKQEQVFLFRPRTSKYTKLQSEGDRLQSWWLQTLEVRLQTGRSDADQTNELFSRQGIRFYARLHLHCLLQEDTQLGRLTLIVLSATKLLHNVINVTMFCPNSNTDAIGYKGTMSALLYIFNSWTKLVYNVANTILIIPNVNTFKDIREKWDVLFTFLYSSDPCGHCRVQFLLFVASLSIGMVPKGENSYVHCYLQHT